LLIIWFSAKTVCHVFSILLWVEWINGKFAAAESAQLVNALWPSCDLFDFSLKVTPFDLFALDWPTKNRFKWALKIRWNFCEKSRWSVKCRSSWVTGFADCRENAKLQTESGKTNWKCLHTLEAIQHLHCDLLKW